MNTTSSETFHKLSAAQSATGFTRNTSLHAWALVLAMILVVASGHLGAQTPTERGATGVATLISGFVVGVTVTDGGVGYALPPTVSFTGGGGTGAEAYALLTNGSVSQVVMTDAGTGYVSAPGVIISLPPTSLEVGITLAPLVRVKGEPGSVALIQWASSVGNPNQWTTITSVVLGAEMYVWCDTEGTQPGQRFYRAVATSTIPVATNMAMIPAGSFTMGDALDGYTEPLPLHTVTVSAFYMDKYEVSKALWDGVYTWAIANGYSFEYGAQGKEVDHPVQNVSWYDSVKWCNARSQKEGRTPAYYTDAALTVVYNSGQVAPYVRWDQGYRLPTEAEWERAARGGASGRRFPWGNTIMHSQANYKSSSSYAYDISPTRGYHPTYNDTVPPYTSPVGTFSPNGYGLYDMTGNVWEWCWDWYGSYGSDAQTDPRGAASGSGRVNRGGSWDVVALHCGTGKRIVSRSPVGRNYDVGFRTVLPPGQP